MSLITKTVKVSTRSKAKYYESLGYEFPRYINKYGKLVINQNEYIEVKVEDLPKNSAIKVFIECDCCGKKYWLRYNQYLMYKRGDKNYCCNCSKTVFNSGENNPNWNPNLTDEERINKRKYEEYTEFVKKVLARDNYTCQCCGKYESGKGVVHHLDGYNWCIEKRTDETNGITLCENCHDNFHTIYGYGNNTRGQFEEWIGHAVGELEKYNGKLPTARKVICLETKHIYNSVKECANSINGDAHTIYEVCNKKERVNNKTGRIMVSKTYRNKHYMYLDEYEKMSIEEINNKLNDTIYYITKGIINLDNNYTYDSIKEASEKLNIPKKNIINCCKHRKDYCLSRDKKIYRFMYLEEYNSLGDDENVKFG